MEEGKSPDLKTKMELMTDLEREHYQAKWLREMVQHAYQNAPAIRQKYDEAQVDVARVRGAKDLEELPIIRKDELLRQQRLSPPFGGFLAVPIERLKRIYISPGPIYDPHAVGERAGIVSGFGRMLRIAGFGPGDRVMITISFHMVPAGLVLDEVFTDIGCTVIPTGTGQTELQLDIMRELKATGFAGSTSFLMTLVERAKQLGYDFRRDFELRKAFIGGEIGSGWVGRRKWLEEECGIITTSGYGTADAGMVAYECPLKSGYHVLEDVILEIVDPQTGRALGKRQLGEIVVTPRNTAYPLIRFGTGDVSYLVEEPCPCGRTNPRLGLILGRVGDAVKVREIFVYPRQVDLVVQEFKGQITNIQVVVTRPTYKDQMIVRVELVDEAVDAERIQAELYARFAAICTVKPDHIEFVPRGAIAENAKKVVDERVQ